MQLHLIRGGDRESLEANRYNIGVGISLGNKWFSVENIVGLIEWSLQHSREHVIVYVADSIHAINIEVRNGFPADKAYRKALELGDRL